MCWMQFIRACKFNRVIIVLFDADLINAEGKNWTEGQEKSTFC